MAEKSLKNQAEEIITAVERDLQAVEAKGAQRQVNTRANAILETIFDAVSDVDLEAAAARVEALKAKYPGASLPELSQRLIRDKCQRTGAVGAVTTGAGLIPGIGTAAALTLGVAADIGATFKMQSELVLELAALYGHTLTDEEKQRVVMLITGLGAGSTVLARSAGRSFVTKAGEKFAGRAFLKAIPVIGVIAMAGTNVLSTYVIGHRADAYFRLGPDAVGSWTDSLRAVSGVDERKISEWLADSSRATGAAIKSGASKVSRVAGESVASGGSKLAEGVSTGTRKAGQTAQRGISAYFQIGSRIWGAIFGLVGGLAGFVRRQPANHHQE